ncbi:MAG: response regulator transcription factor [Anaerolineae bacterium]|nr:response regulator transcription factor [Anaerolineae bacterium]
MVQTPIILLVEDDPEMLRVLQMSLEQRGVQVHTAMDGVEGLRTFVRVRPDLAVLDVYLPQLDGVTLCRRIRELSDVPILMMSADAIEEEDIVEGLDAGADEYIRKPIGGAEFAARVNALLRRAWLPTRSTPSEAEVVRYDDGYLTVDIQRHRVVVAGQEERLTPTEFKLLVTFIRHPGQVLTFRHLLEQVWGEDYATEHHYPRIYVSHLRRKIEPDSSTPSYIHNEYGVGYRFVGKSSFSR